MGTIYTRVTRIAGWAGWCTPCEREDRPLVLTRSGPGGVRAWLSGLGDDDRLLLLTCRVCGSWQLVPAREEDDPEVVLSDEPEVHEAVAATLHEARTLPMPVPLPRAEIPVEVEVEAAPPLEAAPAAEAPASIPQPRAAVPRIVTVPDSAPALTAVSPEAVAAAARVLAAARAQSQRTPSAADRTPPLDRSRRARSGPTPRRATRTTTGRSGEVVEAYPTLELPPSIALPAGTSQVVLAAAG